MTVHFRTHAPSKKDDLGALAVSVLVGTTSAAVAYYLTRLFLSRERLGREPGSTDE